MGIPPLACLSCSCSLPFSLVPRPGIHLPYLFCAQGMLPFQLALQIYWIMTSRKLGGRYVAGYQIYRLGLS